MLLSDREIAIVLAIVKVFETGEPLGDPSAVAVLKDGAGISYGLSQFTHKSGNLFHVLERYRKLGGPIPDAINNAWGSIQTKTAIAAIAGNAAVKRELARLGKDPLMVQAQLEIAREKFLNPAIKAAAGSHFTTPLALAVIYDSKVHGSFARIRDRVAITRAEYSNDAAFEQAWIAEYVRIRRHWLATHTRKILNNTVYRMDFFLGEIRRGNWQLKLPLLVYGRRLTPEMFATSSASAPIEPEQQPATNSPPVRPTGTPKDQQAEPLGGPEMEPGSGKSEKPEVSSQKSEGGSEGPKAEEVVQYIPKITRAITWLGTLGFGGIASTTAAAFNELPPWAVFTLGALTAVIIGGLALLFIRYYAQIFALVRAAMAINTDPTKGTVTLTSQKPDS